MFNFDITKGRSGISALLASLAIVLSGATFSGAVLAQPSGVLRAIQGLRVANTGGLTLATVVLPTRSATTGVAVTGCS